jgi:hypothetical protein
MKIGLLAYNILQHFPFVWLHLKTRLSTNAQGCCLHSTAYDSKTRKTLKETHCAVAYLW